MNAALRKTTNLDDGKKTNVRVAHGVLSGGAFSDSEICAEYFGGILASSRTDDGQDDDAIQFVEVTKALSSGQLHLHYVVYNSLNKLLVTNETQVNVGMGAELQAHRVWFSSVELVHFMKLKVATDLHILHKHGLITDYQMNVERRGDIATPYCYVAPSVFGVLLYAISHSRYSQWHEFNSVDFGDYEGIPLPSIYKNNLENLVSDPAVRFEEVRSGVYKPLAEDIIPAADS